jgi:hypothetical protein
VVAAPGGFLYVSDMKRPLLGVGMAGALALGASGHSRAQAPTVQPSAAIDVTIEATLEGGGKPVVVGATNLPDGFEAIVSLKEGGATLAQDTVSVHSGHFTAGPFTDGGAPYPAGLYSVTFDSPATVLQPQPVQDVIGKDGILLRGPLVVRDALGLGRVVHYESRFDIQ